MGRVSRQSVLGKKNILMIKLQKLSVTNMWQFKEEILGLELTTNHLAHQLRCPKIQVAMQESLNVT